MDLYLNGCKKLSSLILTIASIGLIVMTMIITWQIFDRYVLNDTPNWSERLSIFLLNWYVFLGVAVGVHEDFHLGLVFLREKTNGIYKILINNFIYLAVVIFAGYMFYYGIILMQQTWSHTIPALGISTAYSYLPIPISALLIVIFSIQHLILINIKGKAL